MVVGVGEGRLNIVCEEVLHLCCVNSFVDSISSVVLLGRFSESTWRIRRLLGCLISCEAVLAKRSRGTSIGAGLDAPSEMNYA